MKFIFREFRGGMTPSLLAISWRLIGRASLFARGPGGSEAAAFKRCFGITPRENREQFLLRDGVNMLGRSTGSSPVRAVL